MKSLDKLQKLVKSSIISNSKNITIPTPDIIFLVTEINDILNENIKCKDKIISLQQKIQDYNENIMIEVKGAKF